MWPRTTHGRWTEETMTRAKSLRVHERRTKERMMECMVREITRFRSVVCHPTEEKKRKKKKKQKVDEH